ncbi:MAG TPA: hypothetical protein VG125_11185 [Pirellulales bacterium]|nr:hypothetical protein [Pirellulales bacterium]
MEKTYLGDGVYVEIERGMFKLTTSDGISTTNVIYLEIEAYEALVRYARAAMKPTAPEGGAS